MTIENLQFMSDLTPAAFAALDPASLFNQSLISSFTLSSSQALSPSFPTSDFFPNSITEPAIGNYDVAEGLIFNPTTGDTVAFLDAIQAIPEPASLELTLIGVVSFFTVRALGRRRARSAENNV